MGFAVGHRPKECTYVLLPLYVGYINVAAIRFCVSYGYNFIPMIFFTLLR